MEYDVFISHASEDKESFVEPLAKALKEAGLSVWYDRFQLKLGDRLREKIDQGLANSRYGVVVLSKLFFAKEWPKAELDALVTRQNEEGKKVILPIWHNVNAAEVRSYSPLLASQVAARSSDGTEAVVAQILDVCSDDSTNRPVSVFQRGNEMGLRKQCLEIIRQDNKIEWIKLLRRVWTDIPERILTWKPSAESAWQKGNAERDAARSEAVEICLPSFVPILVAVESGKKDLWQEAVEPLPQLALLSGRMGGGFTGVINIGSHMLYIAGSLGMAIAAETKQLDFVNSWMRLPMPATEYGEGGEKPWAQIYYAHRLWGKYIPGNREPFEDILKICESDYLSGFFPDRDKLVKYLLLANLGQSLFELGRCVEEGECLKSLEDLDKKRFWLSLYVWPVWALMEPVEFKSGTWELFGSSKGALEFVFQGGVSLERFWGWWKKWKEICVQNLMQGELHMRPPRMLHADFLLLPGEPTA